MAAEGDAQRIAQVKQEPGSSEGTSQPASATEDGRGNLSDAPVKSGEAGNGNTGEGNAEGEDVPELEAVKDEKKGDPGAEGAERGPDGGVFPALFLSGSKNSASLSQGSGSGSGAMKLPMSLNQLEFRTGPTVDLYPLANYTFDSKAAQVEKDTSVDGRLERMRANYNKRGIRETVEGVLLAHDHGHPHVLLLQINAAFFKLPGGRLRPGENEVGGLKRKLTKKMASIHESFQPKWQVGDLLSVWWRPSFEPYHYPYIPAHVTAPKERRRIYLVPLPEKCLFAVPQNLKLRAVPLFELYDNANRYGPIISALPQLLSRFNFNINT